MTRIPIVFSSSSSSSDEGEFYSPQEKVKAVAFPKEENSSSSYYYSEEENSEPEIIDQRVRQPKLLKLRNSRSQVATLPPPPSIPALSPMPDAVFPQPPDIPLEPSSSQDLIDEKEKGKDEIKNENKGENKGENYKNEEESKTNIDDDELNDKFHIPETQPLNEQQTITTIEENSQVNNNDDDDEMIENPDYAAYFCTRAVKVHIRSPLEFTFKLESTSVFFARTTGIITDHIYISANEDIKIKEKQYDYVINVTKSRTHFVLQKNVAQTNEEATDLLIIDFDNNYGEEYGPRKIEMVWPQENLRYLSRIPKRSHNGSWQLNFNGKYVLQSQKNAIMLDENAIPAILIRKIEKQVLELEVIRKYKPIDMFALAVSSFVCPI